MITLLIALFFIILGIGVGFLSPTIPYVYSSYLAIAIMAATDSIIGAWSASIKEKFDLNVFVSGFFVNAFIAIIFTVIGESLNVDIYIAAIFVFVFRIFNNLSIIRRHFLMLVSEKKKNIEE